MIRAQWLAERRRRTLDGYDTTFALSYDEDDSPLDDTHRRFVTTVLEASPPGGDVLDAACGIGRYVGLARAAGRRVTGVDQSAGMLARARAKYPDADLRRVGLQELDFDADFDAVL